MFTDFITGSLALSTPDHLHLTIASSVFFEERTPRRKAELQLLLSYNIGPRLRKGNFAEKSFLRRGANPARVPRFSYSCPVLSQRCSARWTPGLQFPMWFPEKSRVPLTIWFLRNPNSDRARGQAAVLNSRERPRVPVNPNDPNRVPISVTFMGSRLVAHLPTGLWGTKRTRGCRIARLRCKEAGEYHYAM
jgi:hypothetical protein